MEHPLAGCRGTKSVVETLPVSGATVELGHNMIQCFMHLDLTGDRIDGNEVEVIHATVPHELRLKRHVLDGGRIPESRGLIHTLAESVNWIGKGPGLLVAARTGNRA